MVTGVPGVTFDVESEALFIAMLARETVACGVAGREDWCDVGVLSGKQAAPGSTIIPLAVLSASPNPPWESNRKARK